jgi:hypothetical protein
MLIINLNRRRLAQELMHQYACGAKVDVVFISEPYQQQAYWYNDDKGDTSLWVTLFQGKHPDDSTLFRGKGLVGIKVNDAYCIGEYCSPNVNIEQFNAYLHELDSMIRINKRNHSTTMIAGILRLRLPHRGGALKPVVGDHIS